MFNNERPASVLGIKHNGAHSVLPRSERHGQLLRILYTAVSRFRVLRGTVRANDLVCRKPRRFEISFGGPKRHVELHGDEVAVLRLRCVLSCAFEVGRDR